MKTVRNFVIVFIFTLVIALATIQPAFAEISLKGDVPVGQQGLVIIQANNQKTASGVLKFKFSAPTAGAYAFNFCIGPATNPCGLSTSYVVVVHGGEERLAVVDASFFQDNVLTVSQGTTNPLPFSITIE